jgi:mRNA-degrading endonuclease RelE of RelBE toxin-antitoxin system
MGRRRAGGFRVIFTETELEIVVHAVGPRGAIYQDIDRD